MDYHILYIDMPCTVKGTIVQSDDGFFNIYINVNISYAEQQKAINHELTHILHNDFANEHKSIYAIENIG